MKELELTDRSVCDGIRLGMAQQVHTLKVTYGIDHVTKTATVVTRDMDQVDARHTSELIGAELIRDTATTMARTVGDGSSTAALLTESICSDGLGLICDGFDPAEVVRGIKIGVGLVRKSLKTLVVPLTQRRQIAGLYHFSGGGTGVTSPMLLSTRVKGLDELELEVVRLAGEESKDTLEVQQKILRTVWFARRRGAVPGGGIGLWRAAEAILAGRHSQTPGVQAGIKVVGQACGEPFRQIVDNFGRNPERVQRLMHDAVQTSSYNAKTGRVVDRSALEVFDPLLVLDAALTTAGTYSGEVLSSRKIRIDDRAGLRIDTSEPETIVGRMLASVQAPRADELPQRSAPSASVPSLAASDPSLRQRRARTVSSGFSEPGSLGEVYDAGIALRTGSEYWFWIEVGEPVAGSIEEEQVAVPELPVDARLRVVLFNFVGEIELKPGHDSGDFVQNADGSVRVARQPSDGPHLRSLGELSLRRMFFPVRTPARTGEYRFRWHIYHGQTLLQARVVHALVSAEKTRAERALYSRLDYNLSASLAPARLGRIRQPALNVLLNEDPDGTHTLRFCSGKYTSSAHFAGDDLIQLIDRVRESLNEVSWGEIGPWKEGLQYRYRSGKTLKSVASDLAKLAEAGWQIYNNAVDKMAGELDVSEMERLLNAGTTVEVVHREAARVYLPASMFYDYPFDIDAEWQLCPDFEAAFKTDTPLANASCFKNGCSHRGTNVLCPSGFWGYRHVLGFPLSLPPERDGVTHIPASVKHEFFAALALDLADTDKHLTALHCGGWAPARLDSRKIVLERLKAFAERPPLIYFYCHGGVDLHGVPYLRVGKAKEPALKYPFVRGFDWRPTHPLVILNGCRTAALKPDKALDLITPFVRWAGASGVIGTEITIFEPLAQQFGVEFVAAFLSGRSVGEAVREVRLSLLKAGNPLGLVYVPYVMHDLHLG